MEPQSQRRLNHNADDNIIATFDNACAEPSQLAAKFREVDEGERLNRLDGVVRLAPK